VRNSLESLYAKQAFAKGKERNQLYDGTYAMGGIVVNRLGDTHRQHKWYRP